MQTKRIVDGELLIITDENDRHLLAIWEYVGADETKIILNGDITLQVAHDFEDELTGLATVSNHIVIEFSGVNFISSAGLKTLLSIQQMLEKKKNTSLVLRAMNAQLMTIFQETGFADLFDIES